MVVKQLLMSQSDPVSSRDLAYVLNLSSGLCSKKRSSSELNKIFFRSLPNLTRKHVGRHALFLLAYSGMRAVRQHAGVTTVSSCLCGRDSDIEPLVHLQRTNKWGKKNHFLNVKELSCSWLNKWIQKKVRLKFLQTAEGNREVEHGELHFSQTMGFWH